MATVREKGCPWGRTLTTEAPSPATAATAAASPVPMLRMPITFKGPSPARKAFSAAQR